MSARGRDVLAYVDWVWWLERRAGLDLAPGDASFDEIAAAVGVPAPVIAPGERHGTELGTAQLYWPAPPPR